MAQPTVRLPQGVVVGVELQEVFPRPVEAFLGIPYALPPIGDLRFRPAVRVNISAETFDASKYSAIAPGKALVVTGPQLPQSEDCLTVNVFRQKGSGCWKKLPVAIYVHGGAFNRGSASMHNTPSMLGWSEESFVAVSFNYRLGALGFLPSSLAKKEGILNLGLHDQLLLFEWVQENIHCFGGDAGNVTLVGLSAGAHSIGHHLMNYCEGKTPLFQRAIIESGAPTSRAVRPYDAEIHEQQFKDFLEETNCPENLPEEKVFPFLRSLPSSIITSAQTVVFDKYNPSLRWAFQPVIDNDIISRKPLEAWLSGKWNKVPIMTGFNTNEGTMYVDKSMSRPSDFRLFWRHLLPELSPADLDEIERLYPNPENDPSSPYYESRTNLGIGAQFKRIEAAYAHYAYIAPVRQTAHFTSAGQTEPVYLYHWALAKTVIGRANHADNMRYETCDAGTVNVTNAQRELAQTLHAYVTSFITKGDPNALGGRCATRPEWKAYEQGNGKVMIFGDGNEELIGGGIGTPAKLLDDVWAKSESDFWWSKVEISQQ